MSYFQEETLTVAPGPPQTIELFKIGHTKKWHPFRDASFTCMLQTFQWDTRPQFDAISITWEDSCPESTLVCDNEIIKAPGTLVQCLEQLNRDGKVDSFYWAFTVTGDKHSGYQVILPDVDVAAVFSAADQVICWLGSPLTGAFNSLPDLCKAYRRALGTSDTPAAGATAATVAVLDQYNRDTASIRPDAWRVLDELVSRRFFARSWVAVEAMSARNLTVRCGPLQAQWDDLCFALRGCDLYACPSPIASSGLQTLLSVQAVRAFRKSELSPDPGRLIQHVLAALGSPAVEAKNPNDRIRGTNYILNATHSITLAGSLNTYSSMHAWCNLAIGINALLGRPFTLSLAGTPEPYPSRSSWVPDWDASRTRFLLDAPDECFSASPIEQAAFSIRTGWSLVFEGLAVGRVAVTVGYLPLRRHADHFGASDGNAFFLGQWFEWAEDKASRARHGDTDMLLQFAETIQAQGCGWKYAAAMPADRQLFKEQARRFLDFLEDEDADESYEIRLFYAACYPAHGRVFGITSHGRFCLLPPGAAVGDVICIPHGSRVPVLLRVMGDCYHNVGECYIHGMMHGQAAPLDGAVTREFKVQ